MPGHQSARWAKYLLPALLINIIPHSLPAQRTTSPGAAPPRILAHYMPWYMARPFSSGMGLALDDGHV